MHDRRTRRAGGRRSRHPGRCRTAPTATERRFCSPLDPDDIEHCLAQCVAEFNRAAVRAHLPLLIERAHWSWVVGSILTRPRTSRAPTTRQCAIEEGGIGTTRGDNAASPVSSLWALPSNRTPLEWGGSRQWLPGCRVRRRSNVRAVP